MIGLDKVVIFYPSKTYEVFRGGCAQTPPSNNNSVKTVLKNKNLVLTSTSLVNHTPFYKRKKYLRLLQKSVFVLALFLIGTQLAHAQDLLVSAYTDAHETFDGSGKKILYLVEIIVSVAGFMKTRNLMVLTGCVVIAIFINYALKISGIA